MSKRKQSNETPEETLARQAREVLANHATRSEKVSWERQYNNLQKLLSDELAPIEDEILSLITSKNEVFDKMTVLRDTLRLTCIHPLHSLVEEEGGVHLCKFCDKRIKRIEETSK